MGEWRRCRVILISESHHHKVWRHTRAQRRKRERLQTLPSINNAAAVASSTPICRPHNILLAHSLTHSRRTHCIMLMQYCYLISCDRATAGDDKPQINFNDRRVRAAADLLARDMCSLSFAQCSCKKCSLGHGASARLKSARPRATCSPK